MKEFQSLNSMYKHLEKEEINCEDLHQIANLFQEIRDEMHLERKIDN